MIAFSRFLLNLSAAILALLVVTVALAVLALGTAAAIRTVLPDSAVVTGTILNRPLAWAKSLHPQAGEDEARAARDTNLAIRSWAFACGVATLDENGRPQLANPTFKPVFDQLTKIQDELFYDRLNLAGAIEGNFAVLEWATIAGILIGMATTICAGLRSDDETLGSWKRPVRILAVVFPALGTAVAAGASFYGPREEVLRGSQSLAALQQVHTDIQMKLGRERCPLDEKGLQNIAEQNQAWGGLIAQQGPATAAARMGQRVKEFGGSGARLSPP